MLNTNSENNMKNTLNHFVLIVIIFFTGVFFAGCITFTPSQYGHSLENNYLLKKSNIKNVRVGIFTLENSYRNLCRAIGPIDFHDQNIATYIKNSLIYEFKLAGIYNEISPAVIITGKINDILFSSGVLNGFTGTWLLNLTLNSSNGKSMNISEQYIFRSDFIADTACHNVATALPEAVSSIFNKTFGSDEFQALFN